MRLRTQMSCCNSVSPLGELRKDKAMLVRSRSVSVERQTTTPTLLTAEPSRQSSSQLHTVRRKTSKEMMPYSTVHIILLATRRLIYDLEDSWRTWRVGNGGKPFHSVLFDCRLCVQDTSAETRERKMQSLTFSLESRRESTRIAFPLFTISSMQK